MESLLDGPFKDLNPTCQLCYGGDFNYVPAYLLDEVVSIPNWGVVNCGGIFEAALTGNIFNQQNCAEVTPYFREVCCAFPDPGIIKSSNFNQLPWPSFPPSSTGGTCAHQACSSNTDCCHGFICRDRGGSLVCSKQDSDEERIANAYSGTGVGGGYRYLRRFG